MAKKIVWTKRANSKFNKIIDHLEREWGVNVTQNFIKKTYDIIHEETLKGYPVKRGIVL